MEMIYITHLCLVVKYGGSNKFMLVFAKMAGSALTNLTLNNDFQKRKRPFVCDSENIPPSKNIKFFQSLEDVITLGDKPSKKQLLSSVDNGPQDIAIGMSSQHDNVELNHSCQISDTTLPVSKELNDKNSFSLSSTPAISEEGFFLNAFCGNSSLLQTCYICENLFEGRHPLLLGCLHVYCSSCILQQQNFVRSSFIPKKTQSRRNDSFAKCFDVNTIPDKALTSLESLHEYNMKTLGNRRLGSLMVQCHICERHTKAKFIRRYEFINLKKPKNVPCSDTSSSVLVNERSCTNCEEDYTAIRFCKECNEHLCKECVNAHKRLKITKEHVLQVLQVAESKCESGDSFVLYCTTHPKEEIKLFCETCKTLTCRDCQLKFHRDHKYLFVTEAANNQVKSLNKIKSKLMEKKLSLEKTTCAIETQSCKISKSRDKAIQDIVAFHQKLHEKVETQCRSLVEIASENARKSRTEISDQFYEIGQLLCSVNYSLNFIDFATEKQNNLALLDAKEMIVDYMKKVQLERFTDTPVVTGNIVFVPRKDVVKVFEDLGSVSWNDSDETEAFIRRTETKSTPAEGSVAWNISGTETKSTPAEGSVGWNISGTEAKFNPAEGVKDLNHSAIELPQTDNWSDTSCLNSPTPATEDTISLLKKFDLTITDIHSAPSVSTPSTSTSTSDVIEYSEQSSSQVSEGITETTNLPLNFCESYDIPVDQIMPFIVPHHHAVDQKPRQPRLMQIAQRQRPVPASNSRLGETEAKISTVCNETLTSTTSTAAVPIVPSDESLTAFVPSIAERLTHVRSLNSSTSNEPGHLVAIDSDMEVVEQCIIPSEENPHKSSSNERRIVGNSPKTPFVTKKDWCAVCNTDGGLLRCDACLRVFHNHCHVPEVIFAQRTSWQCMLCVDADELLRSESEYSGRRSFSGLQERELKICEKLTLELYCYPQCTLFHRLVRMSVENSPKSVGASIDLLKVKERLSSANPVQFATVEAFLRNIFSMFTICFRVNRESSPVGEMGKTLQTFFIGQVKKRLPEMASFVDDLVKIQRKHLEEWKTPIEFGLQIQNDSNFIDLCKINFPSQCEEEDIAEEMQLTRKEHDATMKGTSSDSRE